MKIRTFDEKKQRNVFVGDLKDKVFTRKVGVKHYMILEKGYGLQMDVINKLVNGGCEKIVLKGKTKSYEIPMHVWITKGHKKDYGHGMQLFLDKKYYEI